MADGAELIAAERRRQVEVERYTSEGDDHYDGTELLWAAHCYLHSEADLDETGTPVDWPWHEMFWKPTPDDRIRELVKAGALIAAEIDRLQRAS